MQYTVREFVEAARRNGLKHVRNEWFTVDEDTGQLTSGCIMGQASHNLYGIDDPDEATTVIEAFDAVTDGLGSDMINLNDGPTKAGNYRKYSELVTILENRAKGFLDKVIDF